MGKKACAKGRAARALALSLAFAACGGLAGASSSFALPAQFGERGSQAGQFIEPRGVSVAQSGAVYLVDRNNNRTEAFSGEGAFEFAWGEGVADGISEERQSCTVTCFAGLVGSDAGEFNFPEGVAVDNSLLGGEDVYVADQRNHRVEKFASDGSFILMFGGGVNQTKVETLGATEAEQNLCTAASGNVCRAGTVGTGKGQFKPVLGTVAVDNEGTVYAGDSERVQKFNDEGEYAGQLTLAGAGSVTALAVDSAKNVYVLTTGVAGVRKFNPAGTELGSARDATGEPSAIAVGSANELFVDDGANTVHHMLEFDPSGTQLLVFDAGEESGFRGIAFGEGQKVLYVLNREAVRILAPPPVGPLVLSQSTEAIGPTGATLTAVVNPEGPEATSYHFDYGTSEALGSSTPSKELKGGAFEDQPVSAAIEGLQPDTHYFFRVVLENAHTTSGAKQSFTTLTPVLIESESTTSVSSTSARLLADLNPLGRASEYHFEWGRSTAYEHSEPSPEASAGSGHADVPVALDISGLEPSTIYHYRVVAHNSLGPVAGEDRTFTTEGAEASTVLPDGRAWEMVSPPDKEGVSFEAIAGEGGVIQSSESGAAITYIAKSAIEAESPANRSAENTQVLSRRGANGWQSKDISTPHETVAVIRAGFPSEYRQFSLDLSAGVVEPQGSTPLSELTTERTPYMRENGSAGQFCASTSACYRPLAIGCPPEGEACPPDVAKAANVPPGTEFGGVEVPPTHGGSFTEGVEVLGASADASRIVLTSPRNLIAGFEGAEGRNLYEWSGGGLRAVSILLSGESTGEAGLETGLGNHNESNVRGAISSDGDRVVFEAGHHLYLRDMALGATGETVQLDALQGGIGGNSEVMEFQGAGRDASEVLFTDDARLTSDATAKTGKPDLYECEIAGGPGELSCTLRDLTVDAIHGETANVQGDVTAFGEDGRLVYFAANGVLAEGATPANCAEASEGASCNLYVADTQSGETRLVARLSGLDGPDWLAHGIRLGELTARSSPDGRRLAFMSARPLTGYDNRDVKSGARDEEVFLYDEAGGPSGSLTCVSCKPSGARPEGVFDKDVFPGLLVDRTRTWNERWLAGSIPGWTMYDLTQTGYQSRFLADSGRLYFNSNDSLVPKDGNGKEDVYQYEPDGVGDCAKAGGCVNLISSGTSGEESAFLDANVDGSDAFFLTAEQLSTADVDGAFDVYDAHVCTAASPCPPQATSVPPPCATTDSCRSAAPPQPPLFGPPASATFSGAGNLAPPALTGGKPAVKPKPPTRAQLLAKALKACKKKRDQAKRLACERQARRRYGPKKAGKKSKKAARRASAGRGKR